MRFVSNVRVLLLRRSSVKPGLGHLVHWQTVQTQIKRRGTRPLIRICTVCLNYSKLRVKWNNLKSPSRTVFPANIQRQWVHQCYQCFHYENTPIQICRTFHLQKVNFSDEKFWYCHISAQNIGCGYSLEPPRRGGSNEYPQSMFLAKIRKNNVYPCKPQFY